MNHDDLYGSVSEPIAVVRKKFLFICDNDMCAAMLLDRFYARFATSLEFARDHAWARECGMNDHYYDPEGMYEHTYTTIQALAGKLFDMFEPEYITESLVLLQNKGYIEVLIDRDEGLDLINCDVDIACNIKNINGAVGVYKATIEIEEEEDDDDEEEDDSPIAIPETPRPVILTSVKSSEEKRAERIASEVVTVKNNNKRASRVRLAATLTIDEWIATLDHFKWNCAYCQKRPYAVLEHFVPIVHGGGTLNTNCVPSCASCNGSKSSWNPLASYGPDLSHMKEGLDRVKAYFDSLPMEAPTIIEADAVQQ